MTWTSFFQRLTFFGVISGLVVVLITMGVGPTVALSAAAAIVFIARDMWLPAAAGAAQQAPSVLRAGAPEQNDGEAAKLASFEAADAEQGARSEAEKDEGPAVPDEAGS
ncbi:hypothetical protein [Streptomyces sp. NPDC002685]|uniref:hypothetical protein n=1 Tax=Streptomyces sp. NPDC002685 TaxID=3154540 RepID=UPI0033315A9A